MTQIAFRQNEKKITAETIDEAIDRVIGGPQKKSRLMQDRERLKNEGQAYANDIIPKAKGAADRLMQEAEGYKAPLDFWAMTGGYWTVNSANNTKNVTCSPKSFEGVDPSPGLPKQCYCDENKI